jgi:hypothetical protein
MPAAATPAKRARRATATHKQPTSLDYVQKALHDLEKARTHGSKELRTAIDGATERLREASSDLRSRAGDQTAEWEKTLERASDDALRELGRLAIRAQRTPEALTVLSTEIRKRKAQLT